jgi:thiamine biosynthesis lipoprotein
MKFEAIGTYWQIDINSKNKKKVANVFTKIKKRIDEFDRTYSRFRDDSLIMKFAKKPGSIKLPADSKKLFSLYLKLYRLTDGLFTPLVGNLLEDAGYDKDYSLKKKKLTPSLSWEESIRFHYPNLEFKKPAILDFGAGGKGYLIDIIAKILEKNSLFDFVIDAGGDILFKTSKNQSLKVGLENPLKTDEVIGVCEIKNNSISGSSGNRRKWENFHHIINPKTLSSPTNILATWAIAKNAFLSDVLATCLFLVSPNKLKKHFNFHYLILKKDFSIIKSSNFPGKLFYDRQNS